MFDLFRSRQKAVRILLGVLLGMVALSMLVYLIPGAGAPMGNRDDQIVADVGKDAVTVHDVEVGIRNILQGKQVPPDVAPVIIPQVVDQAIVDRAMAYEAKLLGFQVSDRDLANMVRSLGPQVNNPVQYRMSIEQMGQTVPEFEANLLLKAYEDSILNVAIMGILVPPAEVEAAYRATNDKVKLEYIPFDPGKLGAELKPTPEQLQAYYMQKRGLFNLPETRDVEAIVADQAKVAASIQIPDSDIQRYYNSHKDDFRTPERVKARHILVSTADKPKDEIPKLKAKAEDLLKQVKAGGDFAKLAEKNSDDPGSGAKGGDLGWVVRGQMVKEFEDATFALQPQQIGNLVTTQYGFHIIQVMEKEPARLRSLDEVKGQIGSSMKNQMVFDRMQTLADQARAELAKNPQNAEQIAAKFGLEFVKADKVKQGDPIGQLGTSPDISAAQGSLQKGAVSQVLQAGNKLGILEVTGINPVRTPELSEVEGQVRLRYQQDNGGMLVTEKAKKAAEMAKANGGDLNAVAKSMKLEVKTTDLFTRSGAAEGLGSASYLGDAFGKPIGTVIGPLGTGSATIVAKVIEKVDADMSKLAEQREQIVEQLRRRKLDERQFLLQDSVLSYLIQKGKVKKHQDVINRVILRYRG